MCFFEVVFMDMFSQFHGVKFLGIQHTNMKYSYYLLFLGVHVKGTQKYSISQCKMEGCFPDYLNDKHARQNFKRKVERYKWDETRQKLFYPKDYQFKK